MVRNTNIVHQVAALLICSAGAVHPCDCLQEIVVCQLLVQVHDLLDRSVKSCQQHGGNDKDTVIAIAAFQTCLTERGLKAINDFFILALVGVLL